MLRGGFPAAAVCAVAAALVALPSAGFALGKHDAPRISSFGIFTPASLDPRLAKLAADTDGDPLMRFTPAGATNRQGRSVTVAVRVDGGTAQLVSVRSALAEAAANDLSADSAVRIAPTRYNLGIARGYQSFASTPELPSGLSKDLSSAAMPDLAKFAPSAAPKGKPSRFGARISLEEQEKAGRSPRTLEALGDQSVDLAGSYRLTKNLDVTAGLRYSQDRDRLAPLTNGNQDSQAVYVGTQFRF